MGCFTIFIFRFKGCNTVTNGSALIQFRSASRSWKRFFNVLIQKTFSKNTWISYKNFNIYIVKALFLRNTYDNKSAFLRNTYDHKCCLKRQSQKRPYIVWKYHNVMIFIFLSEKLRGNSMPWCNAKNSIACKHLSLVVCND